MSIISLVSGDTAMTFNSVRETVQVMVTEIHSHTSERTKSEVWRVKQKNQDMFPKLRNNSTEKENSQCSLG